MSENAKQAQKMSPPHTVTGRAQAGVTCDSSTQEAAKLKASLGYTVRPCLKIINKQIHKYPVSYLPRPNEEREAGAQLNSHY